MGVEFCRKSREKNDIVSSNSQNYLVFKLVDEPMRGLDPLLAPSAECKSLFLKQMLAFHIQLVDGAMGLVEHQVVRKVVDAKRKCGLGMALFAMCRINENAYANMLIDRVVVVKVKAADGGSALVQVNHQAELFLAVEVVVAQQELLDLEQGIRHMGATDAPNGTVVFPAVNLSGIFRLGAA